MSLFGDLKWVMCHLLVTGVSSIRDRHETKAKILEAVGTILEKKGFSGIGVNNIAREAGVDKVLIYRYFGGLAELLHEFAEQGDYWPTLGEIAPGDPVSLRSPAESSIALLKGYLRELKKRNAAQELLRGELVERNDLSVETAEFRERQGRELIDMLSVEGHIREDLDIPAVAALLSAGFTYLLLRSKTAGTYLGIDLNSDKEWQRIEDALELLVNGMFSLYDEKQGTKDKE